MSARSRRIITTVLAIPLVIGMHQWPVIPAHAASWKPEVQQLESVRVVDTAARKARVTAPEEFAPGRVEWPVAEEVTVDLQVAEGKAQRAGGSPIALASKSADTAQIKVLDLAAGEQLVGPGVVVVIQAQPGADLSVALDYSGFASAVGAGYANRLRLVTLPECALTSPERPDCQQQTELTTVNDVVSHQLMTDLAMPGVASPAPSESSEIPPEVSASPAPESAGDGEPEPTPEPVESDSVPSSEAQPDDVAEAIPPSPVKEAAPTSMVVLAAAASTESDQGDFGATSLKPSSAWSAGDSSGQFAWSYPLRVPTTPGGVVPTLALSYSSGGTDGGVSNTNNQASWVGEGFELGAAFIERKYQTCYDDRDKGNNSSSNALDLCWYTDKKKDNNEKWDNAFLSMEGHSGELVRDGDTPNWRLEKDDGTRIAKLGSTGSNNEYWRITTPDGTQYFFGKGKADGASAPATNSKWVVPVAANHSNEPGYKSSFADSFNDARPWRWNLDYVVSPTGNTITYYYVKEKNKYKRNLTTSVSYDRGGYLTRIQYGERKSSETSDASPGKVAFTVEERCDTSISSTCKTATPTSSTAKAWPDVPMDALCDTYCPSQKTTPTFFTRKRVSQINTYVRNTAGGYDSVDRWTLGASFPRPTDGAAVPTMWLSSIAQAGLAGGTITLPSVALSPIMLDSRIKGSAGVALEKPRLGVITSETGAQTIVNYSTPECTASTVPTTAQIPTNTKRCMPVWYSSGTAAPTLQWFNKYVVTKVTDRDLTASGDVNLTGLGLDISPDIVTNYTYEGGGAWRHNDSPMTKEKYRTWGEWRGYSKVTTAIGAGTTRNVTSTLYFRGMNGDKNTSGTKSVSITDSEGGSRVDEDWFAGLVRETRTLTAVGGSEDSGSIMEPYAKQLFTDGRLTSRQVDIQQTDSRQKLASGGYRRGRERIVGWDPYGQPTIAESLGDMAVQGDETCTRTTYATPSDAATGPVDRVTQTTTMPTDCNSSENVNQLIAGSRHYYGTTSLTAPVSNPALETRLEVLTGSGTARSWPPIAQTAYDQWGRVVQATDPLGNVATSSFSHTTGGLLSSMTTTTADPDGTGPAGKQTTTTTFDPRRGVVIKLVEPAGQTTEATYDALGRTTAVWRPGRAKSQTATETYGYAVSKTAPTAITTKTLLPNGSSYATSISLLDSLLRPRQDQVPGASAGRIVTDTRYDSRGNAVLSDRYYNSTAPGTTLVQPANRADIPTSNRSRYDFAGRMLKQSLYSAEQFKWETSTSYEGDRVKTTPPAGGTPTTVVSDHQGRTTALTQHLGTTPAATGVTTRYAYDPAGNLATMVDAKNNTWRYTYDLAGNQLTADDPDKGLTTMTYNIAGQLTTSSDARGVTLKYYYDNLGRPTKTTKADGVTLLTSTVYDTVKPGLVTSTSRHLDGGTVTNRINSYDVAGRPTSSSTIVPAVGGLIPSQLAGTYTTTTSYNADGSTNTIGLPAAGPLPAETLSLGYTSTGLAYSLTGSIAGATATYVINTQYLQYGTVSAFVLGTHSGKAMMASYTRDPATLRLTSTQLDREVTPSLTDEHTDLAYDPAGRITQVRAKLPGNVYDNQCFGYDYQGQLSEAWTPGGTGCDTAARSQSGLAGPSPYWTSWQVGTTGKTSSRTDRTPTSSTTTSYSYNADGAAHPHFITGANLSGDDSGTASYAVDEAGNTTSRPGPGGAEQTLVWDEAGQFVEVREGASVTARMAYDAGGARLLRQQGDTTTLYLAGTEVTVTGAEQTVQPPLQPETSGEPVVSGLRYYSHAGQTLAVRSGVSNDSVLSLIPDHQGTVHHQVVNATGQLRTTWQDPYGGQRGAAPAGWTGERGFVGGTKDATGLVRVGARDYDPVLQRFVTVDPVQDVADPLQWNAYLYANNSPITNSDPSGLKPLADGNYKFIGSNSGGWTLVPTNDSSSGGSKSGGGTKTASGGKSSSGNPGGVSQPAQDPQRDFWGGVLGFAAGVAVGIGGALAVGAICVGTAGIGCLVVGGIVVGAASGFASYGAEAAVTGRFDTAEAVVATVMGGALGGLFAWAAPVVGPMVRSALGSAMNLAKSALAPLGTALGKALGAVVSGARSVAEKIVNGVRTVAQQSGRNATKALPGVTANKVAGDAFRDQVASRLASEHGFKIIGTEVSVKTPLGRRVIDILAERNGGLVNFETKLGGSRYLPSQRAKDWWISTAGVDVYGNGSRVAFPTVVIRGPLP
ncbi:MAG: RHS repeat-associated core domain-containing protein [Propionicimonas sp.]